MKGVLILHLSMRIKKIT
ncbi:hypothetical protein Golax_025282 [Gossypium laxum]|uniref:Uncharacterized protein n=3 Tax=Gossypium TaxID=3633 RepID=A0A7J8P722_GOSRA|nr:hypothetical protein [Gossypium raimondii]MBA0681168.1 hypothetical protein [Gossypium aridum]MBA0710297.1 hypothetical protein [Gossypium laxum]